MARLFATLLLVAGCWIFAGCAETPEDPNRVSTIPWNRPEKWEGQGAMGGFNPQNY